MGFAHGAICVLLAGLFAGLMGWFARQLALECAAKHQADARDAQARELAAALALVAQREAQVQSLEAEVARHEGHIVDLANEIAERDVRLSKPAAGARPPAGRPQERDAEVASLQQQLRRLESLASRCREAELRADAVMRDRDTVVVALRSRLDAAEALLHDAREREARSRQSPIPLSRSSAAPREENGR